MMQLVPFSQNCQSWMKLASFKLDAAAGSILSLALLFCASSSSSSSVSSNKSDCSRQSSFLRLLEKRFDFLIRIWAAVEIEGNRCGQRREKKRVPSIEIQRCHLTFIPAYCYLYGAKSTEDRKKTGRKWRIERKRDRGSIIFFSPIQNHFSPQKLCVFLSPRGKMSPYGIF